MPDPSTDWQDTLWRWWRYMPPGPLEGRLHEALIDRDVSPAARETCENVSVGWGALAGAIATLPGTLLGVLFPRLGMGWGALLTGAAVWIGVAAGLILLTRRKRNWRTFLPYAQALVGSVLPLLPNASASGAGAIASGPPLSKRPFIWWKPRPDVLDLAIAFGHRDAPDFAHELLRDMRKRIGAPAPELVRDLVAGQLVPRLAAAYALTMAGAEAGAALEPICTGACWLREPGPQRATPSGLGERFWAAMDGMAAVPVRPPGWQDVQAQAREIIEVIASESAAQYASCYPSTFCPECLERFEACRARVSRSESVAYYACPVCRRTQGGITHRGRLVAVLDAEAGPETCVRDGELRANWLARARARDFQGTELFDFDRVEVVHATDEDVHHLLVDMANDTDETRRKRYRAMECTVLCRLQPNTLIALGKVFGKVRVSDA